MAPKSKEPAECLSWYVASPRHHRMKPMPNKHSPIHLSRLLLLQHTQGILLWSFMHVLSVILTWIHYDEPAFKPQKKQGSATYSARKTALLQHSSEVCYPSLCDMTRFAAPV